MAEEYLIERSIEINAGHRVALSGASACKNLHGHIYKIVAVCRGPIAEAGDQQGMVIDFSFLKQEMMREIHDCCDHAMILGVKDPLVEMFVGKEIFAAEVCPEVARAGFYRTATSAVGALYVLPQLPTAEVMAAHWYNKMRGKIADCTKGCARLSQIKVFETPTSMAAYPA